MNELDLIIRDLKDYGITEDQSKKSLQIINLWANEEYPIMGALIELWLKENGLIHDKTERDNA